MRRAIVAVAFLSLAVARGVHADPITLTSGELFIGGLLTPDGGFGRFSFAGDDFASRGTGTGIGLGNFLARTVSLSGPVEVFPDNAGAGGSVTAGGETLRGYASTTLHVIADPVSVSGTEADGRFNATGTVALSATFGGPAIFTREIAGSGTLQLSGVMQPNGVILPGAMRLTFEPAAAPSPTPEPASLLLLGSGLAAAWHSRRLRRSQ